MDFVTTKQHLEHMEETGTLTLDEFLSIIQNDLVVDVKNGVGGYKNLPIQSEEDFVKNLTRVTTMIGLIYDQHRDLFTDQERRALKNKAYRKLDGLNVQLEKASRDVDDLEDTLANLEKTGQNLQKQIDRQKKLGAQIQEREALNADLDQRVRDSKIIQQQIEHLKKDRIPQAEQDLSQLQSEYSEDQQELIKLQSRYTTMQQELEQLQLDYSIKQHELEQIRKKQTGVKEELQNRIEGLERENNDLNTTIGKLIDQQDSLNEDKKKSADTIREKKAEIEKLQAEAKTERENCQRIEEETQKEQEITSEIKAERVRLDAELLALRQANGRENANNADLLDEINRLRESRSGARNSRDELIKERDQLNIEIGTIQGEIENYKKKKLEDEAQKEKICQAQKLEADKYMQGVRDLNEMKWQLVIDRSRTKMVVHDAELWAQKQEEEQRLVAEMIANLLNDPVVAKNWMYKNSPELENKLRSREETVTEEIKGELELLNQIMRTLETGR